MTTETETPLPTWSELTDLDKGAAPLFLHARDQEGEAYAVENYLARYFDHPALTGLSPLAACRHAIWMEDDAELAGATRGAEFERLYDLALNAHEDRWHAEHARGSRIMTEKTPGQAAYEYRTAAEKRRFPTRRVIAWDGLSPAERADEEAAAQAAIETAAEHPVADVHRWYAVVKHCGSFAYGFAATSDGLRVWDDASEFEHAKEADFE